MHDVAYTRIHTCIHMQWEEIHDIATLWEWIRNPLLDLLYKNQPPGGREGALLGYDYILNGIRLRQIRVFPETCRNVPEWAREPFELGPTAGKRCFDELRASMFSTAFSGGIVVVLVFM
jgi:hypothetical protein